VLTIFGYLDPGTGSMLLQLLLGGFAAVGVAAKLYWSRIKSFLRIGRRREAEPGVKTESQLSE
jgi:hypothetical protein